MNPANDEAVITISLTGRRCGLDSLDTNIYHTIEWFITSYYFLLIYAEIKTLEHDRKWKKIITVM